MARFEVANNKTNVNGTNTLMWQFKTSAGSRARIFEMSLSLAGATTNGPSWRLVRSATLGTATVTVSAEEEDPGGGAATAVLDTTWPTTPPTFASVDLRRYATPNTVGSGIVWTWPDHRPLIIPASSGICIINATATGASIGSSNITVVFEE